MELTDKVIIVTGGASGIGRALCERFVKENPKAVVVVDIVKSAASSAAEEIRSVHPSTSVEILSYPCDVANEDQIKKLVADVESQFGRIDLFCANAGIGMIGGVESSNEVWQRVMDVNFMSHVYSSRAVLPGMIERGQGYLLHTSSAAGLLTQIGSAPYSVSKHAALSLAEWLSIAHRDQGIVVSCLCPLGVWTNMIKADDPTVRMLHADAISAEQVADTVVEGIRAEQFLILPHPQVNEYIQNKASNYDRWLAGMRKLRSGLERDR